MPDGTVRVMSGNNLSAQSSLISEQERSQRYGQNGLVVWFTGLSGSGKTTIALEVEKCLFEQGRIVFHLDGDRLRQGLNAGLGFSEADRAENIRRAAEVAKLFQRAGLIVLASFISPRRAMRAYARDILPAGRFVEIYVKAALETCIARDPKGYYKKAMAGEIKNYTGIAQEYEEPLSPELILDTDAHDLEVCVRSVIKTISPYIKV